MKWKTPPSPQFGEYQIVNKFAFRPTELETNETVWLEHYQELQYYTYLRRVLGNPLTWEVTGRYPLNYTIEVKGARFYEPHKEKV